MRTIVSNATVLKVEKQLYLFINTVRADSAKIININKLGTSERHKEAKIINITELSNYQTPAYKLCKYLNFTRIHIDF